MKDTKKYAKIFKALGDENRLRLINLICDGINCPCKMLKSVSIEQSTLSHHMKILCDADIILVEKSGTSVHYFINPAIRNQLDVFMEKVVS